MQVYPEKYDKLEISAEERSILRTIDRAFEEEEVAYYVLHINPRKKDVGNGMPELFNLLIVPEGIILFRVFDLDEAKAAALTIKALSNPIVFNMIQQDIISKLEESRYLVNNKGELRFALNVCMVFSKVSSSQVILNLSESEKTFCTQHVFFKEDILSIRKNGRSAVVSKLQNKECIREEYINNVFQRLCPEITIPRKFTLDDHESISIKDDVVSQIDRAVQSYRLDKWQIDIINRISKGNQLILACAGSGKSVLLISKCFKLASLNPSEAFLITCYNRNLNDYYQWAIAQAGFIDKNVRCSTFLGLCKQLLERNGVSLPTHYNNKKDDYYDRLFERANEALSDGRIKDRFLGIFIDEVQIFKPEWYRFCFNLLKSKNESDHYFVIAGDKSQDIKSNIKHGKAPWQGGGSDYPEYRGKTLPIERNYRNSKPINDAIDRFVSCARSLGETIGVDLTSDPELFLRGTAYRPGNPPKLLQLTTFSNKGEAEAICDSIQRLLDEGYSEVDIAVILYNSRAKYIKGWETSYYNLMADIRRVFIEKDWEHPAILLSKDSEGATFGSRRGVTIATIEGSLGLDFRAVVLAGLRPLGIHEKARSLDDFKTTDTALLAAKREAFMKNVNFLYTGCTRARDELSIVLSDTPGNSVYLDLLSEAMGD